MKKLLFFLLLLPVLCYGQAPIASFTASPTTGCAPLLVQFTNTSSAQAGATYSWSFGNGASSVLQNPSTTFLQAGSYTVSLTVTNPGGGSHTKTETALITVRPDPTVSWTVSDSVGCPPHQAVFTLSLIHI